MLVVFCPLIILCKYEPTVSFAIIKLIFIFNVSWKWGMSYLSRSNIWNEYIFDFLFYDISACMFEFTSEWKLEMFGKSLKETEIVVRAHCLHTPFKGEAICEHKNPKNCPNYGVGEKGYKDIDQWMLGWDIHMKPTKLPQFWYTQKILIKQWVLFQKMGIYKHWGWEIHVRLTKLPQFWCLEKNLNERGMLFQKG